MPCVYVHLGLPKTATTTLQHDFFPYIDNSRYIYLGVEQPRSKKSDVLYEMICNAVNNDQGMLEARQELISRLNQGKSLIISEEMFVVSTTTSTWQVKLKRLANLLFDVEYKILVTVREPVSAMFSFYVELSRFAEQQQPWQQLALNNNDFYIYHYEKFFSVLDASFESQFIFVAAFENIINGDVESILDFLDNPTLEPSFSGIGHQNKKPIKDSAVIIHQQRSLKSLKSLKSIYQRLRGRNNSLLTMLKNNLQSMRKKFPFFERKKIYLNQPSVMDRQETYLAMQESIKALNQKFGIDYSGE